MSVGPTAPVDPVDRYVQTIAALERRIGDLERATGRRPSTLPWGLLQAPVSSTVNGANVGGARTLLTLAAFTAPGGRWYRLTGHVWEIATNGTGTTELQLWAGATQFATVDLATGVVGGTYPGKTLVAAHQPAAGSVTYTLQMFTNTTNAFAAAAAAKPMYLFVEDMGAT